MSRYAYNNTTVDQNGKILGGATVSLYLTGTTTPAKMYAASAGGTAVYSTTSSSVNGSFTFYVDDGDYAIGQKFDIVTTYPGFSNTTISAVAIYNPNTSVTIDTDVTLAADSNIVVASQHATKTYADTITTYLSGLLSALTSSLGTAAYLDVGTAATKVVQLTAAAKLPAVDGSLLTNIPVVNPRAYLAGLGLSNAADTDHDITVAAGSCRDSANAYDLLLASAITKQIDAAWAAGTNAGGMFTGAVGVSTWYHLFLIRKTSDGTIDAGFDTSTTAANKPAGYGTYRRIGSVQTDGSSNIIAFLQSGDLFQRAVPVGYTGGTNPGTGATLVAIDTPLGIRTEALLSGTAIAVNDFFGLITDPATTDTVPSNVLCHLLVSGTTNYMPWGPVRVGTNTSSQFRYRLSVSGASTIIRFTLTGYYDRRGRDD